ncbi:nucleoside diphosphate kinase [Heterostelium album PN500]|uniref:Nucleoside diphosphate kinase n=1 Tax=Heterostelium pallidum (strain ATCC 26659 / Pp 5 / PN500) TaxID=670386 RepID=D3BJU6_HETP5|nr:nucleoside diphosphate kinase [Heterostelium album PN500]EFA78176.1 nucleoside diphosphate kinase [Heterostelium album PN500]|eukprot:XP_020430302.1 nucleoside diphosphate kinase [Heterostelium album PN500]
MSVTERSFIAIKPDGVARNLVGEIIARFERKGFVLVGLKQIVPTADLAKSHYAEHAERPFFGGLVSFITSGPVVAMVWEGKGVIAAARALIGATNPLASAPGTIRGDLAIDVGRNIIHGSDSVDSAKREIALWFAETELLATATPNPHIYEPRN